MYVYVRETRAKTTCSPVWNFPPNFRRRRRRGVAGGFTRTLLGRISGRRLASTDFSTEAVANVVDDRRERTESYVGHDVARSHGVCSPPRCRVRSTWRNMGRAPRPTIDFFRVALDRLDRPTCLQTSWGRHLNGLFK